MSSYTLTKLVTEIMRRSEETIPDDVQLIAQDGDGCVYGWKWDSIKYNHTDEEWKPEPEWPSFGSIIAQIPRDDSHSHELVENYDTTILTRADIDAINAELRGEEIMATPTALFNHVLSLMVKKDELLDNDIQYIAQDGSSGDIYGYEEMPEYDREDRRWGASGSYHQIDLSEPDLIPGFDTTMLNRDHVDAINAAVLAKREEIKLPVTKLSMRDMLIDLLRKAGETIPPEVKWIAQDANGQIFGYSYKRIEFKPDMRWTRKTEDMDGTVYHLPADGSPDSPRVHDFATAVLNSADIAAINDYLALGNEPMRAHTKAVPLPPPHSSDENDVENW